jgi:hypothetical protein
MPVQTIERPTATLNKLKGDMTRCIASAEALGLTAIAIYLQRALDELSVMQGQSRVITL